jgi:hypothetical protein
MSFHLLLITGNERGLLGLPFSDKKFIPSFLKIRQPIQKLRGEYKQAYNARQFRVVTFLRYKGKIGKWDEYHT